jgi:hypothetical protein
MLKVRIQDTWSCVADSAPFTCGRQDHADAGDGDAEQDGDELHRQQDQPLP